MDGRERGPVLRPPLPAPGHEGVHGRGAVGGLRQLAPFLQQRDHLRRIRLGLRPKTIIIGSTNYWVHLRKLLLGPPTIGYI